MGNLCAKDTSSDPKAPTEATNENENGSSSPKSNSHEMDDENAPNTPDVGRRRRLSVAVDDSPSNKLKGQSANDINDEDDNSPVDTIPKDSKSPPNKEEGRHGRVGSVLTDKVLKLAKEKPHDVGHAIPHSDRDNLEDDEETTGNWQPKPNIGFGKEGIQKTGGYITRAGIRIGSHSRPGDDPMKRRKENQDCFVFQDCFGGEKSQLAAVVLDGHGPYGAFASQFVRDRINEEIMKNLSKRGLFGTGSGKKKKGDNTVSIEELDEQKLRKAFRSACLHVNKDLSNSSIDVYVSGSTCTALFMNKKNIWTMNVGDSRIVSAIKGKKGKLIAEELTIDQKPDRQDEEKRIRSHGGRVFEWGVPRVWLADMDMPGLAMARSFGDSAAEQVGVFAEPEVEKYDTSETAFIILGSDGVWEFIQNQEAVDLVAKHYPNDPQLACDALVKEAKKRWNREEDVVDDITALILYLK